MADRAAVAPWLADQAPNLLLYMGAFLIVMAALIILNLVALLPLTLGFLVVGGYCRRFPRVVLAGNTFVGIGALLTPLNFVSAAFLINPDFQTSNTYVYLLWLGGSVYSLVFYGALTVLGLGKVYRWLTGLALMSGAFAAINLLNVQQAWIPLCAVVFATLVVVTTRRIESAWPRAAFDGTAVAMGHVLVGSSAVYSVGVSLLSGDQGRFGLWALPATLVAAFVFYAQPRWVHRAWAFAVIIVGGAAVIALLHPLNLAQPAVYGLAVALLGLVYGG
ncbi:MAG: hypothetical protein O3B84_06975, partial [Chloroflexi bacterium]|nr:hypothetical protein [Chloroflexota bacterium]